MAQGSRLPYCKKLKEKTRNCLECVVCVSCDVIFQFQMHVLFFFLDFGFLMILDFSVWTFGPDTVQCNLYLLRG